MAKEGLKDKLALVTGGSRGIGRHTAAALRRAGARVVITARHEKPLRAAAEEIGPDCVPLVCDHSDPESIRKMADQVLAEYGAPDILVNNAGCMRFSPVLEMAESLWDEVIGTNLKGIFLTTQAFLPGMIEKNRADIFMISSMSGRKGDPGAAAYSASKFGVQGFSQALQYEVRKHNIRVMVLNPSQVAVNGNGADYGPGLHLHAADIAATIAHLACLPGRTLIRDMDIWGTNP
jgi:3-oxoacyl-[acyl-carrier protein] reductase